MIDEDLLRDLMADAANAAPAPGRAPDALLDALAAEPTTGRRLRARRRPTVLVAASVVVLAVVVAAAVFGGGSSTDDEVASEPVPSTVAAGQPGGGAAVGPVDAGSSDSSGAGTAMSSSDAGGAVTAGSAADSAAGAAPVAGAAAAPPSAPPAGGGGSPPAAAAPADTARVIKTGSIDLEIRKGAFDATIERVTSLATGLGGYVAESTTTESDDVPHGSITVRVPANSFDQLVTETRRLGHVNAVTSKGTDVTAQFTDLDARLAALTATRDRLYEVLRGARNIGDIIAVQDRITGVQTEIEQIQGQQRLLTDQTSFGTLAVTVAEPGATQARVAAEPDHGLGAAWREARRRFGNTIEGLIEWSGTAGAVALITLAVAALIRLAWTRGRRRLV